MKKTITKQLFHAFFSLFCLFTLLTVFVLSILIFTLPDIESLKDNRLQEPLRVFTQDGQLIAEFGEIRRIPVTLDKIPALVIYATLATEDQRFFSHAGVDPIGLLRAGVVLLVSGEKKQGGSTITMQVARNFFLTRHKTFFRKIKEILLAIKIDQQLSKEKILELYLNKVFYGNRAYGIAAAAKTYYNKSLQQLTLSEIAMLVGLPKAPSKLNPLVNPVLAKERRNHVLERMRTLGYIDQETYEAAILTPITAKYHGINVSVQAPYIAEIVRRIVLKHFGDIIYTNGLNIYTTIDSHLQMAANKVVKSGILAYDRRHGYRGAENNLGQPSLDKLDTWRNRLKQIPLINGLKAGIVLKVRNQSAEVLLKGGEIITLPWSGMRWARKRLPAKEGVEAEYFGRMPECASDILRSGDIIRVEKTENIWQLRQIPEVEAALVALNPADGAISALVGGFSYHNKSKFNRVTQSYRQVGSSFKPFVYSAALEKGFTLASLINDAPVVIPDSGENTLWRPENHSHLFYGPTRLRVALTQSRNLVSIRLLQSIGIDYALNYLSRFGFDVKRLPHSLSLALGTAEITPLRLTAAYAAFANGGYLVKPYIIDHITTNEETVIYQAKPKAISTDQKEGILADSTIQTAPRIITSQNAYLITKAMQDVIQHGTGRSIYAALHRSDLAGKTGTTNNRTDTWFSGFNQQLVATVWVGFDQLRPLHEYASRAAIPLWRDFMKEALAGQPEQPFSTPPGIVTVRIDKKTGLLASQTDQDTMFEVFREEFIPKEHESALNTLTDDDSGNEYIGQLY